MSDKIVEQLTAALLNVGLEWDGPDTAPARALIASEPLRSLLAQRAAVEALADKWASEGIACECGHYIGSDHNGRGCYGVVTYSPLVRCSCPLTDNRREDDVAVSQLRAALEGDEAERAITEDDR